MVKNSKEELLSETTTELNDLINTMPDMDTTNVLRGIRDLIQVSYDNECDTMFYGVIYLHSLALAGKTTQALNALGELISEQYEKDSNR